MELAYGFLGFVQNLYIIYIYIFRAGSGFIWGWFGIYLGWVLGLFRNGVALSKGCFKV